MRNASAKRRLKSNHFSNNLLFRGDAYQHHSAETMQKDPVETMHESSYLRQKTQTQTYYKYHCEGTQPYFPLPPNPIDSGDTKESVLPNHSKFCFNTMGGGYWYSPV
jgi:hypothetical protein